MEELKSKIRTIAHWPKNGVMFRDITTLLKDAYCFNKVIDIFYERYKGKKIDVVAGIESRGFILGGALAHKLGCGFVPLRKPGKLPAATSKVEYELEYGKNSLEVHNDAILHGQNVLLVDDLIATSGTMSGACNLVSKLGGEIVECALIVELEDLGGRKKLEDKGHKVFSILSFKENEA